MSDDAAPIAHLPANDTVVAHLVIYASSDVELQYTDELDDLTGRDWLRRRLIQTLENLGRASARVHLAPDVRQV